jgi:hypothetical protein
MMLVSCRFSAPAQLPSYTSPLRWTLAARALLLNSEVSLPEGSCIDALIQRGNFFLKTLN